MQITRQADYAVRAVLYLARMNPNEKATTKEIAEAQDIPSSFLAKIIAQLSIVGLLHTTRGVRGGVTLARSPEEIPLLDVIEAIDGPILVNECVRDNYNCSIKGCPIRTVWCEAQADLINRLQSTTFASILAPA